MIPRRLLITSSRFLHTTPAACLRKERVIATIDNHEFHKIIKYNRPEKLKSWDPRKSGDLRPLGEIDPKWLKFEFQPFSEVIDKLPEEHRRIFTVGFGKRSDGTKILLQNDLDKTRRHKYDTTSLDFKVTWSTWRIRNLQDLFAKNPTQQRSRHFKVKVKELIEKRGKWLNQMRHQDYKRFEWIIEVLGVIYKNTPKKPARVERKASINVLVNLYCNEMRDKKMLEYKTQLELEKVPFLQTKLETLMAIRADEESISMPSSVDQDIRDTRKLLLELEKNHMTIHPTKITDLDVKKMYNSA
ncbi:28S ribosomal protein S15, mitochondrial [Orchesella cincta]|uniref:Small ribosomal subunit protein uS15m n=1 Tax=Orchesella cincta TaxID=48709 RepID=A0A1D2MPQ3_ORCCI|nr:28S ribosomal protein S15, mitochondrial [Orchesella cincta]